MGSEKCDSPVTVELTYRFDTTRPTIKCNIKFRQDTPHHWTHSRFNEFGFTRDDWTTVLLGNPPVRRDISGIGKGNQKPAGRMGNCSYTGVGDGNNAFALLSFGSNSRSFVAFFGVKNLYVNGRYGEINVDKIDIEQYIYLGKDDDDSIAQAIKVIEEEDFQ